MPSQTQTKTRGMGFHAPLFVLLWWFFFSTPAQSQSLPGGYISLFNGINLQGWSIQWPGLWWVEDGVLYGKQDPTSLTLPGSRGDSWLYTTSEWDDFALSLRFRITSNGNSGIGFRVPAGIEGRPSQYGYEMQIWKEDPEYPTGSIYLHTKATKNLHRDKEWNQVDLTAVGNHVTVFLNREKVVDARLSGSLQGRIGLQIHGGTPKPDQLVAFQSIQIKDLKPQTLAAPSPITFQAMQISSLPSEGAAVADLNRDGWPDITCGPVWYEGPSWIPHTYRTVTMLGEIMDNSHEIPLDVNQDGWVDLITGGWYSGTLTWWENPGPLQEDRLWQSHLIAEGLPRLEQIAARDINGDGMVDLIPIRWDETAPRVYFAFVGLDHSPTGFASRTIAPSSPEVGFGFGDIDGDGREDWLTPTGWYQPPVEPHQAWTSHPTWSLPSGLAMQTMDVNQDGRMDILYSLTHGFGLAWLENHPDGWRSHWIDETYSQIPSILLADLDSDGVNDLITGKRYKANHGFDSGYHEPLGLYWYKVCHGSTPVFTKHILTYDQTIGAGLGLQAADLDLDGDLDLIAPGKTGLYVLLNTKFAPAGVDHWEDY